MELNSSYREEFVFDCHDLYNESEDEIKCMKTFKITFDKDIPLHPLSGQSPLVPLEMYLGLHAKNDIVQLQMHVVDPQR